VTGKYGEIGLALRPARAEDVAFLFELFLDARAVEFSHLPLHGAERHLLMRMQFEAQQRGYAIRFPASEDAIVWCGTRPVGRLWLMRTQDEIRVLDVALLSEKRGAGIGSSLLRQVLQEGKPVRLSVARTNLRAFELYRRLGFVIAGQNDVFLEMENRAGV
jgi:GNAT superfamily N-acetyltransferase